VNNTDRFTTQHECDVLGTRRVVWRVMNCAIPGTVYAIWPCADVPRRLPSTGEVGGVQTSTHVT